MNRIGRTIAEARRNKDMTQMELAAGAIEKNGISDISEIAPLLSREMLANYVREKYL